MNAQCCTERVEDFLAVKWLITIFTNMNSQDRVACSGSVLPPVHTYVRRYVAE